MSKLFKRAMSVLLIGTMVMSIAACAPAGVKVKTEDEFKQAILDAKIGADEDQFSPMKSYDAEGNIAEGLHFGNTVTIKGGYFIIMLEGGIFLDDDVEVAEQMYEGNYTTYVESGFDGKINEVTTDEYKYFTLNGKVPVYEYCYGGWYYCDGMFLYVVTVEDDDEYRDKVDNILKKLGFPTPER